MASKPVDYDQLGRMAEEVIIRDLRSAPRLAWRHFIGGVFAGLGGVIGASLMVALLLFVLNQFVDLPGVGRFFENLSHTIEQSQK